MLQRDNGIKGQQDNGTMGQRENWTTGLQDNRTTGWRDNKTTGQRDNGTKGRREKGQRDKGSMRQREKWTTGQNDKSTKRIKRELNIVMSGQFRALAMFVRTPYFLFVIFLSRNLNYLFLWYIVFRIVMHSVSACVPLAFGEKQSPMTDQQF